MSKQANVTLIGVFVVGGIALLAIALVLFGGSSLFVKKNRFVTYFEGSVQGLRVGSNVTFRGVRVGYVTDIRLQAQIDSLETLVPVTIEIVPGAFQIVQGDRVLEQEDLVDRLRLEDMIEAGLRAQLNTESFVTGQLLIEMDFLPHKPAILRGQNPPYPEIPTIPNDIEQAIGSAERLLATFREKVDIDTVIQNVQGALQGLNAFVNSDDLHAGLAGLSRLVNAPELQHLAIAITDTVRELDATLAATRGVIEDTRGFIKDTGNRIDPVAQELDATLRQMRESLHGITATLATTLKQADRSLVVAENSLRRIDTTFGDDAVLTYQLSTTLTEVEGAARALKLFLEFVEQHPEAFLRGKREKR